MRSNRIIGWHAGAIVVINVAMVFCCARIAFQRMRGHSTDPLAAQADQPAASEAAEAGEAIGGGTAAGQIELSTVMHPNQEVGMHASTASGNAYYLERCHPSPLATSAVRQ